jgi:hypothetical protein
MARSSPQEEKAKTHHRIRCDDILGNGCRAWVQAPTWSHPEHPLPLYPPITPGTLPHDLDAATLDSMVTSRWPWLLQRVAIHPHTSPATLDKLARQANADPLRQAVARNPRCLANTLEVLAKRSNNDALVDVVAHPRCPAYVLWNLAQGAGMAIRSSIASRPRCPSRIWDLLARDVLPEVRAALAANPNCPVSLLVQLARDDHPMVRQLAADNPTLTEEYRALSGLLR